MKSLARLFISAYELFEAEGRVLKRQVSEVLVVAGIGLIVAELVLIGFCYLQYSLYIALAKALSPSLAALIVGGSSFALAVVGVFIILRLLKAVPSEELTLEDESLNKAKSQFTDAAGKANPLESLGKEPFTLVTVAMSIGVLLGLSESRLHALEHLMRAVLAYLDWDIKLSPAPPAKESQPAQSAEQAASQS